MLSSLHFQTDFTRSVRLIIAKDKRISRLLSVVLLFQSLGNIHETRDYSDHQSFEYFI
jgi:hypothetical protein